MNNLKQFVIPTFGSQTISGLSSPSLTKEILILDENSAPLENVHLTYEGKGVITNQNGKATLTVSSENSTVRISHIGYETETFLFKDLDSVIVLWPSAETLNDVVITVPKKTPIVKKPNYLRTAVIGLGILLFLGVFGKEEKGLNAPAKTKKRKTKKKNKKTTKGKLTGELIEI